jgi:hypothetical protein
MRAACLPNRLRLTSDPSFSSGHVSECLRCQAEAAKYRTLLRYLMQMRSQLVPAPAGLVEVVGRGLSRVTDVPKKSRVREVAFAATGVVAMAGAVTLWRRRVSA